jgi:hypothetical protein
MLGKRELSVRRGRDAHALGREGAERPRLEETIVQLDDIARGSSPPRPNKQLPHLAPEEGQ